MRLRFAVPALLLVSMAAAFAPTIGTAVAKPASGVTINVTPDPIITGEPVLLYGQLNSAHPAHKLVVLFHRVNPSGTFVPIAAAYTDSLGFYEFKRNDVTTNRSYYVLAAGRRSRTVYERVAAALNLAASDTSPDTNHTVMFTGHVDPTRFHVGETVDLQVQQGPNADDWHTIKTGTINASSNYAISYRFVFGGERELRVLFRGDVRNIGAVSDVVTVTVQQTQNPSFTIHSSAPIIAEGGSATVTGNLYTSATARLPMPGQPVQLWGHVHGQPYAEISQTTTGSAGQYSFTVTPVSNEVYRVQTVPRTPTTPVRSTAQLFEAVRDVVTLTATPTSSAVGQTVSLNGTVMPARPGHLIYLQALGADGDWHTVKVGSALPDSSYHFTWKFGDAGTHVFRTLVPGDAFNASGASNRVVISVSQPAVATLPSTP